ncbi:uncharacterized protein LOC130670496 [Microplitis mediator]|uniref:uncharacterized protein LOC130670486 n=1 Tax=Microplitis mediator TaxID=375433 RepID=UPI0025522553|nr:uncharacterized protein LOC130670486 [Microplitis mediator]XP_057329889.1 uncharacterized protein LOC130670496 [Microplitis mediator]
MAEILDIQKPIIFDESISHYEVHSHQPYASSTFNNSDEIRISIQHQDLCILPSKSSLHICGRFVKEDGTGAGATMNLVNMAICHMFEEIRYELNAVEIDRCKNVGLTSLMKNYISLSPGQVNLMENAGWLINNDSKLTNDDGYFNISIPLNYILGFAEDYNRIIMNAKHELILIRSNSDVNTYIHTPAAAGERAQIVKLLLNKVEWNVPYVTMSDKQKIQALNFIANDPAISISFRTWQLYEYPLLPRTTKHVWPIKTSTQLEKPRYVILGFQTARKNDVTKNASQFDHCNIRDVKLFLNSQSYPYGNLNLNISRNQYALIYDMYTNFQTSYYNKESKPLLTKTEYLQEAPLYIIDCSKQNESIKSGPVDIRLEFESDEQFPDRTSAYCLILHDRIIEYKPLSSTVRKLT